MFLLKKFFRIEIQKCVYYDEKNKTHELEDLICKECFMADLRCSQTFKRPALPHRLPSPKYSNRKDCPLCSGPKKDEHKEYVCGGCLNLYDDINNMNYAT